MNVAGLAERMGTIRHLLETTIGESELDVDETDEKPAVDFLLAAREAHRLTGDLARIAEDMVVAVLDDRRRAVIDGHPLEVRRSYRRTDWEHSRVATHVALRALGGEVIDGMDVVIDALLRACLPNWRVTALKDMGLEDGDYCTRTLGRATVTVM